MPSNSCCDVTAGAILDNSAAHDDSLDLLAHNSSIGKSDDKASAIFVTPSYEGIPCVSIYPTCIDGSCNYRHFIGGSPCDLKPCRTAAVLFGSPDLDITVEDRDFLWRGVVEGFAIVDADCPANYRCQNYDSVTCEKFYVEMSKLLREEIG